MKNISIPRTQIDLESHILDKIKELSDIVKSNVGNLQYNLPSDPKFIMKKGGSMDTTLSVTLLEITQIVRSKIPYDVFLRGTTLKYLQDAIETGYISGKKVDYWYENDIGNIAAYKIPMGANNLSNAEFLTRLCLTVASSISYALSHAHYGERLSLIVFAPNHVTEGISWNIHCALSSYHFPVISRDTRYEDVLIGGNRFPVFPENTSGDAFSGKVEKNNYLVINLPEFSREFDMTKSFPLIEPTIDLKDKRDEFKYSFALITTIILLLEMPKFIDSIQELRGT